MPPLPGFNARGLLPPLIGHDETTADRAPYEATMTDVALALGTTPERRRLLKGLLEYRELLGTLGYTGGVQFINGSFVENVEARESRTPGDIDVFSFLERPPQYRNDPALWALTGFADWRDQIANRNLNKVRFCVDTYAVAVDQHGVLRLITTTIYWYSLFAHKKITHDWKGFVRVTLDPNGDAAATQLLASL